MRDEASLTRWKKHSKMLQRGERKTKEQRFLSEVLFATLERKNRWKQKTQFFNNYQQILLNKKEATINVLFTLH